jgi:hypothetical protein
LIPAARTLRVAADPTTLFRRLRRSRSLAGAFAPHLALCDRRQDARNKAATVGRCVDRRTVELAASLGLTL